ncbi:M48 family metallopeptidase [Thiohalophilus sp.]|uniref:M48 family metallopeptidase n=1 Tax=Thiohalophilus sp. TaxID=3028392 RepID=UPI002ACE5216|nr:M48 family metallopeptidase [Thiohalophilus sp.]MDZ7804166.1 M48 family metallopeptidase [Thiohalophilus sp.]
MNTLTLIFVIALALSVVLQLWLGQRQARYVSRHRDSVPEAFQEHIALSDHQKAAGYTLAKLRFGKTELLIGTGLLLIWTLGGGLNWLDQFWRGMQLSPILTGLAVIFSFMLISSLLDMPLSLYRTFRLEERFGFNRMTGKLFVADFLKNMLLAVLIGGPLLSLVLWLMQDASALWWLYVWAIWMGFSLLMMWAYPTFIAPLFNKFSPLDDQALRERIEKLLARCGFRSNGIFVMDGSRRSSHGNAYFTGLGDNKRIVFFDTLLKSLTPDEVEAVLAHELGHFRRRHIPKRIAVMAVLSFAGLALLGWLLDYAPFYHGLGVEEPSTYIALLLFMLVMPVFTVYLQPLMAAFSRKHEFEADDFAARQSDAGTLIQALVKLYQENASTLTPDPVYSAFHDSHPPAPVRIAHLSSKMS